MARVICGVLPIGGLDTMVQARIHSKNKQGINAEQCIYIELDVS